ncbi:MAG: ATP-grasp domain-containing protein [Methylophaga sp.]
MQRPPLLLVFAQSGRFIAESATRAGYPVRVADCFADSDMLAAVDESVKLPPFSRLDETALLQALVSLSHGDPCLLLCGTGIERYYPILARLPPHIKVVGNNLQTLATLRHPMRFFSLLKALAIPHPATSFSNPPQTIALRKALHAAGGSAISSDCTALRKGEFYQQFIDGTACSVCFIADGKQFHILGWNRQINQPDSFRLEQIWQRHEPPHKHTQQLAPILDRLVKATALKGMNSLDYIIDETGQIFVLEVNPRISASAELLTTADWFQWHLDVCQGKPLPQSIDLPSGQSNRLLSYFYAQSPCHVVEVPQWPSHCHDRPIAGSFIPQGDPVCTFILAADSEQACLQQRQACQQQVLKNCLAPA